MDVSRAARSSSSAKLKISTASVAKSSMAVINSRPRASMRRSLAASVIVARQNDVLGGRGAAACWGVVWAVSVIIT